MLQVKLTDGVESSRAAAVIDGDSEHNSLAVATRPLKTFGNGTRYFTSETYGVDMNVNISFSGTPEIVYIDNVEWTATDIVGGGKTTFASADQNHSLTGTFSIKNDNSPDGDLYQLATLTPVDMNGYVALSMWVYVDKDWTVGDVVDLYGFDTTANLQVGNSIDLSNYFDFTTTKVWQKVVVPLSAFGEMATYEILDALRVRQTASTGKAPKYYLDDIQFEQTGTPAPFVIVPDKGTWLHVKSFTFSFAAAIPGTLANGAMPVLSYDKLLGVLPAVGINYQRVQELKTVFSVTFKTIMDLLQIANSKISSVGSDGTNTFVVINFPNEEPLILKPENSDRLQFTVSDDLSGLLHFKIQAGCSIETRIKK